MQSVQQVAVPKTAKQKKNMKKNLKRKLKKKNKQVPKQLGKKKKMRQKMREDIRLARPPPSGMVNALSTEAQEVLFYTPALYGIPIAVLSYVLQNGFLTYADEANQWYGAANWVLQIINNAMLGATPATTKAPLFLVELCKCFSAKTVPAGMGNISFKAVLTEPFTTLPSSLLVGPSAYGYVFPFVIKDPAGSDTDMFPNGVLAGLPADGGQESWQVLMNFLNTSYKSENATTDNQMKVIDLASPIRSADTDVSIFGINFDQQGGGTGQTGGWVSLCGSEVPITYPVLANFGASLNLEGAPPPTRWPQFPRNTSGDSIWATSFAMRCSMSEWQMPRPTKFHAIDFLQFGDILATWVGLVQNQYATDSTVTTTVPATCPLTLQEFLLLLRNELMHQFSFQWTAQGVFPIQPVGDGDNQFVAYISSSNTCPIQGMGMKLPLSIVENIRCLSGRGIQYNQYKKWDIEWFWPVLGQMALDSLVTSNYQYINTEGSPVESFTVISQIERVNNSSKDGGKKFLRDMVEAPIDLVDGYNASASKFVFINDPNRLTQLVTLWNDWISKFDSYCDPLTSIGNELGIRVLTSLGTTRHWQVVPSFRRFVNSDVRDIRLMARKNLNSVYANREIVADTFQSKPEDEPYTMIMSRWVLPVNLLQSGSQYNNLSTIQRYQSFSREYFSKSYISDGETGTILSVINMNYAAKMVRSKLAEKNDWVQFFEQQTAQGRGGILSSLAASWIGKAVGSPEVGSILQGVADFLPV